MAVSVAQENKEYIMSSIKIVFTKAFGQVIGTVTESLDGTLKVEDPCMIQFGNNQLGLIPILGTAKEKALELPEGEYTKQLFTPIDEIYNYYQQQFGSGIQLATQPGNGSIIR